MKELTCSRHNNNICTSTREYAALPYDYKDTVLARKDGLIGKELSKYAAYRPDVN